VINVGSFFRGPVHILPPHKRARVTELLKKGLLTEQDKKRILLDFKDLVRAEKFFQTNF